MTVTCHVMQGGHLPETKEVPLAANGQTARVIDELITNTDTADFVGAVRCTAPDEDTSPKSSWRWTPTTGSSQHCRWCPTRDDLLRITGKQRPSSPAVHLSGPRYRLR